MAIHGPLVDQFGRIHKSLRVSVTDRCNIRCFYCMPNEKVRFKPRKEILSFEEIERLVSVLARLGIDRVRLTGGEPLVRAEVAELVGKLVAVEGIREVAMTTNGILLDKYAAALRAAGLKRLNISLDGLSEESFRRISRREGVQRVLEGIFAAQRCGFEKIRLNAVAIRGVTEDEILPLARFARQHALELRFIEFMPLDGERNWRNDQVLSGAEIRRRLEAEFGPLFPAASSEPGQPAVDYEFSDGAGRVGFISSITEPFCGDCNRLRITAEGMVRNCLFSTTEWDARGVLRGGGTDEQLAQLIRQCVQAKKAGHGEDSVDLIRRPERAMYQIGG